MTSIPVHNKLNTAHAGSASALYPLIQAKTRRSRQTADTEANTSFLWLAEWWGLTDSTLFKHLSIEQQTQALLACNRTLLNEAYFIEKSGLAYTAKMVLLAESTDVAQMYALIGADEARHLAWIEPYISTEDKISPKGQFLSFLSELIEQAPPHLLVYLVQIILEGWGLDHYQRLAHGCQNPDVALVFNQILKDEALHHKSGHLIFDASRLNAEDRIFVHQALFQYAGMIQVGPWAAIEAIEHVTGKLPLMQVAELLMALRHPQESLRKLQLMRSLMRQPGVLDLVDAVEAAGYFTPLPIQATAAQYVASH